LLFAKFIDFYNGNIFGEYAFLDKDIMEIQKIIIRSIKLNTKIRHNEYGYGEISAAFGQTGWIISFNQSKKYVDNDSLIQNSQYELL